MTTSFPHDFSDERYCKALKELFKAGTGVAPPKLAGRETETAIASDVLLGPLAGGNPPPGDMVLFGPRGNGKTVLLTDLRRRAAERQIDVLSLTPDDIDSPAQLIRNLLQRPPSTPASGGFWLGRLLRRRAPRTQKASAASLRVGAGDLSAELSAELSAISDAELRVYGEAKLSARCRAQPLLVTVDEAHTLDIDVGRQLLNLSQALRTAEVPFVLILAGTPNLEAHLRRMKSTFWSRSEIAPIGRLSAKATAEALTAPLGDWSVTIEPDALGKVVDDSQCYPYFIQLWGRALCRALVGQVHGHTVTSGLVEQVAPAVAARRERYYGERYRELKERELLEAAALVAGCFEKSEQAHEAALEAALREGLGLDAKAAMAALGQLADLGYTWAPEGGREIEPGIPSLMSYVREAVAEGAMDFPEPPPRP